MLLLLFLFFYNPNNNDSLLIHVNEYRFDNKIHYLSIDDKLKIFLLDTLEKNVINLANKHSIKLNLNFTSLNDFIVGKYGYYFVFKDSLLYLDTLSNQNSTKKISINGIQNFSNVTRINDSIIVAYCNNRIININPNISKPLVIDLKDKFKTMYYNPLSQKLYILLSTDYLLFDLSKNIILNYVNTKYQDEKENKLFNVNGDVIVWNNRYGERSFWDIKSNVITYIDYKEGEIVFDHLSNILNYSKNHLKITSVNSNLNSEFNFQSDIRQIKTMKDTLYILTANALYVYQNQTIYKPFTTKLVNNIKAFVSYENYDILLKGDMLIVIDNNNSQQYQISARNVNVVSSVNLFDNKLWISTNNGLYTFELSSQKFLEYDKIFLEPNISEQKGKKININRTFLNVSKVGDRILIAQPYIGLWIVNGEQREYFNENRGSDQRLSTKFVNEFILTKDHVYIRTVHQGLIRLELNSLNFHNLDLTGTIEKMGVENDYFLFANTINDSVICIVNDSSFRFYNFINKSITHQIFNKQKLGKILQVAKLNQKIYFISDKKILGAYSLISNSYAFYNSQVFFKESNNMFYSLVSQNCKSVLLFHQIDKYLFQINENLEQIFDQQNKRINADDFLNQNQTSINISTEKKYLIQKILGSFSLIIALLYNIILIRLLNTKRKGILIAEDSSGDSKTQYRSNNESINPILYIVYEKINQEVIKNELFLDSTLTISGLSKKIKISSRQITDSINRIKGQSFTDYINDLRIDYLIYLMKKFPEKKINELYIYSGFNSASTVINTFKKRHGVTPSEYKKQISSTDGQSVINQSNQMENDD